MIRLFILSIFFTLAFGSNLAPFLIENKIYEELVPIPLPWNTLNKRLLNINISVKTNDSTGKVLIANGVEPSDFKIILSLISHKLLLSLTIRNNTPCEICSNNSKNADFVIDFDKNTINFNGQEQKCNISKLERKEDSLEIKVGGIQNGCIKMNGIKVSNEIIKLEASRQKYPKCSAFENSQTETEFIDPGIKVENRGHSHHNKI